EPETEPTAATVAGGWGGDRFAVYEKGGKRLLLWLTEWDSEADATEFQAAAARLGEGWKVVRSAPTRVVLSRGALSPDPRSRVEAALAAVKAERPVNKDIDLAALGIAPKPAAPAAGGRKNEAAPDPGGSG